MYSRQQKELNRQQTKVSKGSMSRREFLSRVSAMGLGAMAPGLYTVSYTHLTLPTTPYV